MENKLILGLISAIVISSTLASCGNSVKLDDINTVEAENNTIYICDVDKSGGTYYVTARTEQDGTDYCLPLSDRMIAEMQEIGVVGAWNPVTYDSASEFYKDFWKKAESEIGEPMFRCTFGVDSDGKICELYEENYYAYNDVTGYDYLSFYSGTYSSPYGETLYVNDDGTWSLVDANGDTTGSGKLNCGQVGFECYSDETNDVVLRLTDYSGGIFSADNGDEYKKES